MDNTASEVAALAEQLGSLATSLLPSEEGRQKGSRAPSIPPLAERLKNAWKGLVSTLFFLSNFSEKVQMKFH